MKDRTEVVGALIFNNKNEFLIFKRPQNKKRGGLWEFVGGKVEKSESKKEALIRECREEIGTPIDVIDKFMEVPFDYPDIKINLTIYKAKLENDNFQLLEHQDYKWISPDEISNYKFCPADYEILEKIKKEF